jgi:hypothetical protein
MPNDMTKEEWTRRVGDSFSRTIPDNHPEGFAYFVAEQLADEGAYAKYVADEYPPDTLYVPEA